MDLEGNMHLPCALWCLLCSKQCSQCCLCFLDIQVSNWSPQPLVIGTLPWLICSLFTCFRKFPECFNLFPGQKIFQEAIFSFCDIPLLIQSLAGVQRYELTSWCKPLSISHCSLHLGFSVSSCWCVYSTYKLFQKIPMQVISTRLWILKLIQASYISTYTTKLCGKNSKIMSVWGLDILLCKAYWLYVEV